MAQVILEGITRRFEKVMAIENITFQVPNGEFWVLVGPSGCGKSTVLRTIAGLESVSEGKLYFDETLMNKIPARQRDVAMVFQNYALYPHLTVAQNLAFGLKMRKTEKEIIAKRVEMVARSLNIEHLLQRKPKQLSGGQQQRVALGRAIARQPKVFLLDEPLSNLDAQLRDETRAELKQLHGRLGITTIYVTHDQVEAMTLADKIVVLNGGKIQQIGEPQAIYAQPANRMVATFLGSPPMNILPVKYSNGKFIITEKQHLPVSSQIEKQLNPQPGQEFDLGIRPEAMMLATEEEGDSIEQIFPPLSKGGSGGVNSTFTKGRESKEQTFPPLSKGGSGGVNSTGLLTVKVEIVEPLGHQTLVRGCLTGSNFTVNFYAPGYWRGYPGDVLKLKLDNQQLFVFDVSSGVTIFSG